jgi:hypothetical protein
LRNSHIIIGLKELDPEAFPLKHTHVQFAHCYKGQAGWQDVLARFPRGGGTLLDLEFLQDDKKRRVAAFGFHAGFAGSALALKTWAWQLENGDKPLPGVENFTDGRGYYENEDQMLEQLKAELQAGIKKAGREPRVLVMGALVYFFPCHFIYCRANHFIGTLWSWSCRPIPQSRSPRLSNHQVGYPRNDRQTWTLFRNHRIRHLRQLHLPLRPNSTLPKYCFSFCSRTKPQRYLRRQLRHYEPT